MTMKADQEITSSSNGQTIVPIKTSGYFMTDRIPSGKQ